MSDFKKSLEFFRWYNVFCIPESHRALYLIVKECKKVENQLLFTANLGAKTVTLDEFESLQRQTSESVSFLKNIFLLE